MATLLTTYGAYGTHDATNTTARIAFAGQMREADTGWYLLGERPYSPTLRRFLAPDRLSPFTSGGINRYAYCGGDPVNRIDPGGNTWLGLFSTLQAQAPLRTVTMTVATDPGTTYAAVTTPAILALAVAALKDTVSVASAVVPSGSMTAAPPRAHGLFGRLEAATAGGSDSSATPPMKRRTQRSDFLQQYRDRVQGLPNMSQGPGIRMLTNSAIPDERIGADASGQPFVTQEWSVRIHAANPRSLVLASDSPTYHKEYDPLFARLNKLGVRNFTHYSGTHGRQDGENWDIESQVNVGAEQRIIQDDLAYMREAEIRFGMTIAVKDIGGWTSGQFRDALSQDGIHTLGSCYGLADRVVRQSLNLPIVTIYAMTTAPSP